MNFSLALVTRLGYLAILGSFLLLLTTASGCASTQHLPAATRADTVLTAAGLPSIGKLVIRGPVTIQQGTGNSVVGKDKTGQRAQAVSTGTNSPVTATRKQGSLPWWVFGLVALGGAIGWEYLSHWLSPLGWLKWRPKVS